MSQIKEVRNIRKYDENQSLFISFLSLRARYIDPPGVTMWSIKCASAGRRENPFSRFFLFVSFPCKSSSSSVCPLKISSLFLVHSFVQHLHRGTRSTWRLATIIWHLDSTGNYQRLVWIWIVVEETTIVKGKVCLSFVWQCLSSSLCIHPW